MLYNLAWLRTGEIFPPTAERARILRYDSNLAVFNGDHWKMEQIYRPYLQRIQSVITDFEDYVQFPMLLNYQKLMSLKMSDLVCGEHPSITGKDEAASDNLNSIREDTGLDSKLYASSIDVSRYGNAVWRVYKQANGKNTFTCWDPQQWYPIVTQDGTLTVTHQVLCWSVNTGTTENPIWWLHAQIHTVGQYEYRVYKMDAPQGPIGKLVSTKVVPTGLDQNAVMHVGAYSTTDTVYGYDDYLAVDSILAELMTRVAQISSILDQHADPSITGPVTMLTHDKEGNPYFRTGKFYGISPNEQQPKYLTWEGQLVAAFQQIQVLLDQLSVLSELGAALLGAASSGSQAVSGTAMRFKMAAPLAKARRLANGLSLPVKQLLALISKTGYEPVEAKDISIEWADGLPDDPRENVELVKLLTGASQIMPLELAIVEFFRRSSSEAARWVELLKSQKLPGMEVKNPEDVNNPGRQDGTGVNPAKKGSETGLKEFA